MTDKVRIAVFGCEPDEEVAFQRLSSGLGSTCIPIKSPITEHNAALAAGCKCVSVSHKAEVSESVLHALKNAGVLYVSTRSIGTNHIDTQAAGRLGITVGTAAYSPGSVADYTLMLMLMAIRGAKTILHRTGNRDYRLNHFRGKELRDMTVGVLGAGRIGGAVIERLKGFGCTVLAYDHHHKTGENDVSFDRLLCDSDIVTLHIPLRSDTYHIIGREQFQSMKQDAFLVNTSRGALVDTQALVEALESGKLGGAALDVLEYEEGIFYHNCSRKTTQQPFLQALQGMPNVIVTPHTAYYTDRVLLDTVEGTIENCLRFERSL